MPGEKMHPSLLRVNQHTERVRKELREMTSEMNHFYQRYSGLDEENEFLRESLLSLLNRINDESVSKELSDLGQEIRSKLGGGVSKRKIFNPPTAQSRVHQTTPQMQ